MDAKEKFPTAYLQGANLKAKFFINLKNFLTGIQLKYDNRVHQAAQKAAVIVSASSESKKSFKKFFNIGTSFFRNWFQENLKCTDW